MNDYQNFCKAWRMAYQMVNAKEPSGETLDWIYQLFKGYPFELIAKAIEHHVRHSSFVIKPADVFAYINHTTEGDSEELEVNAYKFFDAHLADVQNNVDTVIADARFAYAFEQCFGDMNTYFSQPANEFTISQNKKLFAKAVVNTLNSRSASVNHVFKGRRNFQDCIYVQFFGDYDKCRSLAESYYSNHPEFKELAIRYPVKKSMRLENKQKPIQVTEKEKQDGLNMLSDILKRLTKKN